MPNNINRAPQFAPFDALKGFEEALEQTRKTQNGKKDLSEEAFAELDKKIALLKKGDNVCIKHFAGDEYIETIGVVKQIDTVMHKIVLKDCEILFENCIGCEKMKNQ